MNMSFKIIIVASVAIFLAVVCLVVFIPSIIWKPAATTVAHPYSELEAQGRKVYLSNGCNYCHTQNVREQDTAMGPVSEGGNYVYDEPVALGSERTGPDLSYIGRKRSSAWIREHFKDPRSLSPLSIMASFSFLSDEDINALTAYLNALGDRVASARMILPPPDYVGLSDPFKAPEIIPDRTTSLGWQTWNAMELQSGKEGYVTNCLTCHGCSGNGLGTYGGTMSVTPANFKQEPIRSMPDEQWFWHVSEGIPGTLMPTWKASLDEDLRWQIIRYIKSIFANPSMRDPDEGDPPSPFAEMNNPLEASFITVDAGKETYTRECLVCHGASGRGTGPYGDNLKPSPPDFGDLEKYSTYTDADYFWRISEGLPWSAMPAWKGQYSEIERWELVHFLRTIFTQTEQPLQGVVKGLRVDIPEIYRTVEMPETSSTLTGQLTFLGNCSSCHGLTGAGDGGEGQYLNPKPADLRAIPMGTNPENTGRDIFTTITFGIDGAAMPIWGEFLPESQRWDLSAFVRDGFITGFSSGGSRYQAGGIASDFITLSSDNWVGEGHTIDAKQGNNIFDTTCSQCHGETGTGNVYVEKEYKNRYPAAYPEVMDQAYIFWRIQKGIEGTLMYPFETILDETDVWNILEWMGTFPSQTQAGVK